MVWTSDGRYIIKQVNKTDQAALVKITKSYVEHVTGDNGSSLICRFYVHFHRPSDGQDYVVMGSCLPKPKLFPTADGSMLAKVQWAALYDLKGCRDDKTLVKEGADIEEVHMRCWDCNMMCWQHCLGDHASEEREKYYQGKCHALECLLHTSSANHDEIMRRITNDCSFFDEHQLMDYSMVIGVQVVPYEEYETLLAAGSLPQQPYIAVYQGVVYAYYMGIIDFLQERA